MYNGGKSVVSDAERIGDNLISLPQAVLQQYPGVYIIRVTGYQTMTFYDLSVSKGVGGEGGEAGGHASYNTPNTVKAKMS